MPSLPCPDGDRSLVFDLVSRDHTGAGLDGTRRSFGRAARQVAEEVARSLPADTPEGRRDQLERELDLAAQARPRKPSLPRATDPFGLTRTEKRAARGRALARLARRYPGEYLELLEQESAAEAGGR